MKTSYKGCHKKVKKSLCRGEHIKCVMGDGEHEYVLGYVYDDIFPYKTRYNGYKNILSVCKNKK